MTPDIRRTISKSSSHRAVNSFCKTINSHRSPGGKTGLMHVIVIKLVLKMVTLQLRARTTIFNSKVLNAGLKYLQVRTEQNDKYPLLRCPSLSNDCLYPHHTNTGTSCSKKNVSKQRKSKTYF